LIAPPAFDDSMRTALLNACRFDWTPISPAIFGSLFQSVMDPAERRAKGAHYTTEKNIMKVIEPLFLDDLRAEFAHLKGLRSGRRQRLRAFHEKLHGHRRWILTLQEAPPNKLRSLPEVQKRVRAVREFRRASKSGPTVKLADTPTSYHVNVVPTAPFLVIPRHTSERRTYVPFGYLVD
jgi:hypothetical protein